MTTIISADNGLVSGSAGLKSSADSSGVLELQSGSNKTAATFDQNQNVLFPGSVSAPNTFGFKNRIINGDMRIDQRNGSNLLTGVGNPSYLCDRFGVYHNIGTLNYQQNLNSITPPPGFVKYLGVTNTSASTSSASNYFNIFQAIEGYNIADLAWGTVNAKAVTLSFWAYSSVAGTYAVTLNGGNSYGYPSIYTIPAANTWTYITLTIPGPTSGYTWNADNTNGVSVIWDLGQGSNYRFTAGSWQSGTVQGAIGATNWNQTNGATFYITGVQLEKGSQATGFDFRSYGTEFSLCRRYYNGGIAGLWNSSGYVTHKFDVPMRATPTVSIAAAYGQSVAPTNSGGTNEFLITSPNPSGVHGFNAYATAEF